MHGGISNWEIQCHCHHHCCCWSFCYYWLLFMLLIPSAAALLAADWYFLFSLIHSHWSCPSLLTLLLLLHPLQLFVFLVFPCLFCLFAVDCCFMLMPHSPYHYHHHNSNCYFNFLFYSFPIAHMPLADECCLQLISTLLLLPLSMLLIIGCWLLFAGVTTLVAYVPFADYWCCIISHCWILFGHILLLDHFTAIVVFVAAIIARSSPSAVSFTTNCWLFCYCLDCCCYCWCCCCQLKQWRIQAKSARTKA